jgi:hypothetical protein
VVRVASAGDAASCPVDQPDRDEEVRVASADGDESCPVDQSGREGVNGGA